MRNFLCLSVVLILITAERGLAQVTVPATPAGHTLQTWLDAFNSGDRAKIENYVKNIDKDQHVDGLMAFRSQTGGFDLLSIDSSEPLHIGFRVKEKNSETTAVGSFAVKDGTPPTVASFMLRAIPKGAVVVDVKMDAAERRTVIDGVNAVLNEFYVDAALAQQMADALKSHEAKGNYDALTDGKEFASRLQDDLLDVSHDKHLRVDFNPFKMPAPSAPTPEDDARFHQQMDRTNCAFDKVEILPNNIGYVKFDGFMDAGYCGTTVVAAMGFVAHTDAVIFDLRENGGGQPPMVTLIASYLFDKPTHLIDIYNRKENTTTQNWTLSYLPGQRLTKQPVFVLTSKRTFSGAEEFAFDLKNQKRATIVGETTGGGAHPVSGHTVADYFMVGVPFAKSLDPVTKTNWEGTGVEPDVKVPVSDALTTAEKLALEKIQTKKTGK
ncbi:MAG TPA: S41 family peptidase [Acidobacteriaceae bacterium]|nr:S41 family peptidase [Acidobacteriaceae bacterium]